MNKLLLGISLGAILIFSSLTSCKKETLVQNTVTTDTVVVTDTVGLFIPMTLPILTANKWMYEEIRGVRDGNIFYYFRGGSNNSENLDDEYIEFYANNTGHYHEQLGTDRTITWDANIDTTLITIHFTNTPADFDVYWDNTRVKNGKWYFDEYYTDGNLGWNAHGQNIRIPKP